MKKTIIAAVALLCLIGTAAAQRHVEYRWRGFYGTLDMSYGFNLNRGEGLNGVADTAGMLGMGFSAGFQFSKEAGVGVGFTYLADPSGAYTQLPVYVELRSHLSRGQLTPYTALQVGYTMPLGSSSEPPSIEITEGGLYFGLDLGARYALNRNFAVGGHVGYKLLQSIKLKRSMINEFGDEVPYLEDAVVLHMLFIGACLYF